MQEEKSLTIIGDLNLESLAILENKKEFRKKTDELFEEGKEMGLEPGDIVGFKQNRDYRLTIDGQEYYRTRAEDLYGVYVEA